MKAKELDSESDDVMVKLPAPHTTAQKPAGEVAYIKVTIEADVTVASVTTFVFPPAPHVVGVAADEPVSTSTLPEVESTKNGKTTVESVLD